jgi:hypothetical protein
MKWILLCCSILSIFAFEKVTPKLCINCKHFKKDIFTDNTFGKCKLFPKKIDNSNYLVDGVRKKTKPDYFYCSTARDFEEMCGKNGNFFLKKKGAK